jgi:CBS domain-containing protein
MIFTVEDLLEGRSKPVCARLDATAAEAISLMTEHDFSQLPVVNEVGSPVGIITTDSLLRAANHLGVLLHDLKVRDAYEAHKAMRVDGDLFDLLDEVQRSYAVLIVDADGRLTGIVTQFDTTAYFRRRAEDMMVVEDIETTLKEHIFRIYNAEMDRGTALNNAIEEVANSYKKLRRKYELALKTYAKKNGQPSSGLSTEAVEDSFKCFGQKEQKKELDDLTIEEITDVLLRHKACPKIGDQTDGSSVRKLLSGIRDTRNILAHFRGDITAEQRDQLRFCSDWLRRTLSDLPKEQETRPVDLVPQSQVEPEDVPIEDGADPQSTYAGISSTLRRLPRDMDEIAYAFAQIESMIGRKLPASARAHRAWWANDRYHVQARQWLDTGWKVKSVADEVVVFSKLKEREESYNRFFSLLAHSLQKDKQIIPPDAEPTGRSYFRCAVLRGSTKRQLSMYASFARNGKLRIEIYMGLGNVFLNKQCWQLLFERRAEIERSVGENLSWERLDDKNASRVALYHNGPFGPSIDFSLIPWATDAVAKMIDAFREPVRIVLDIIQNNPGDGRVEHE